MILFDSSFLCLDIGTTGVRGIAHHVHDGHIENHAIYSVDDTDLEYALKSVIDELEQKIGHRFDSAYITGNFGNAHFLLTSLTTTWHNMHKISASDINAQIGQIQISDDTYPIHIIPIQYDVVGTKTLKTPIGQTDKKLTGLYASLSYDKNSLQAIQSLLRSAHIQPKGFYDPHFLLSNLLRAKKQCLLFIDLGSEFTTASIWTARGPIWFTRIKHGGADINTEISKTLSVSPTEADRIKRKVSSMRPNDMDRFTPADTEYEFSRADVNDIIIPHIVDIIAQIRESGDSIISKYKPNRLILTGGGAEIANITEFFENTFAIPVHNLRSQGTVITLSKYIWAMEKPHVVAYLARRKRWTNKIHKIESIFTIKRKRRNTFVPIMPSTLCFNMYKPETYSLFTAGGISMIHVDIMDGLYVNKIAGSIKELSFIRNHTRAHLHVHLMTESPDIIASDAIKAGADTIIVSTNTSGLRRALRIIHDAGRRVGIAINPESPVSIIDSVINDLDEVMIMTVKPGAAGQEFDTKCVQKIYELCDIRRNRKLKFKISVDGGINEKTAAQCWAAGADLLVSGSYLSHSTDFPLAVQNLLPTNQQ